VCIYIPKVCLSIVVNATTCVYSSAAVYCFVALLPGFCDNMWFSTTTWSPGTLTNYAGSKRLFKEGHQPNRRRGQRENFLCVGCC
jgi:hypothetical protein